MLPVTKPNIPADVNPYPIYINGLRHVFYRTPTPAFSARTWGLVAFICVNLSLVAIRFGLQYVDHKRRRTLPWVYRWISTPNGTFLILSSDFWTQLTVLTVDALFLAYVLCERSWLIEGKDLYCMATWRSIIFLPLILQTWLLSWVGLLNGLVISQSKGTMWPLWVPRLSVGIFAGGLIAFTVPLVTFSILSSLAWHEVWAQYVALIAANKAALPLWTYGPAAPEIREAFTRLVEVASDHELFEKGTKGTHIVAFTLVILAASSGIPIFRMVRKQITYSEVILNTRQETLQQATMAARYCTFEFPQETVGLAPPIGEPFRRRGSAVSIDYAANQEKRLGDLKRASVKIMTHTVAMMVGCTAILGSFCWAISVPFTNFLTNPQPWSSIEMGLFLPIWFAQALHFVAMLSHIRHTIAHIPKKAHQAGDPALIIADPFEALYRNPEGTQSVVRAPSRRGRAAKLQDHGLLQEEDEGDCSRGIKVEKTQTVSMTQSV